MIISIEKVYEELEHQNDSECSCSYCVSMCEERPCWGTPKDIQHLIDLGHAKRLMQDYWVGNFLYEPENFDAQDYFDTYYDIQIICPADIGNEGGYAPSWRFKQCTFLTPDKKCEIHMHKPLEGKKSMCKRYSLNLHEYVARTWDTPEGKSVVEQFEKLTGCNI